jgi:glycine/D-amino acid oxidase-like deaminating enzyme
MRVLICGGGVIGASIAYFLSRRGAEPVVIEGTGIACAASGKSGGFLALDWCDGSPLEALARRSFALHAGLADELGGGWGYRRLDTYGGSASARSRADLSLRGHRLDWLSNEVLIDRRLGSVDSTAQVHPGQFTAAMMQAAEARGAELRTGRVTGIASDAAGRAKGVEVDGRIVPGDAVVIAMGPWSVLAAAWLPMPAVYGLKGHSLVLETGATVPAEAVFLEYQEARGGMLSPEFFPRADGTTYVCAISSESPLPVDPADVAPDPGAIDRLSSMCTSLSPALGGAKVLASQACYRPVTQDGLPLIGPIPGFGGAYAATGHSVWGILNAPATGEAMAQLICEGTSTVDLAPFDPARLPALDPARLRKGSAAGGTTPRARL